MNQFDEKINELKIILPEPKAPVGAYVATKIVGKLLFISGQISMDENSKLIIGKIGKIINLTTKMKALNSQKIRKILFQGMELNQVSRISLRNLDHQIQRSLIFSITCMHLSSILFKIKMILEFKKRM